MMTGPILGGAQPLRGDARISITGQSNAQGLGRTNMLTGELAAFAAAEFERVYIWSPGSGYVKLKLGVNNLGDGAGSFGPEFGLAVRWMRESRSGNLYVDKLFASGKPISWFQYGDASGHFYEATTRNTQQNNWFAARGLAPSHKGDLWVQGEGNALDTQAAYQTALDTLFASRVTYGLLTATAKRLLPQIPVGTLSYGAGVAAAKDAYAAANPGTTRVFPYSSHYLNDNNHLDETGQVQMGYDAFARFFNKRQMTA